MLWVIVVVLKKVNIMSNLNPVYRNEVTINVGDPTYSCNGEVTVRLSGEVT